MANEALVQATIILEGDVATLMSHVEERCLMLDTEQVEV